MSLMQYVIELVEERGKASPPELMPECEGYTLKQVSKALQNGANLGLLHVVGKLERTGQGAGFSVYASGPSPDKALGMKRERPLNSVWEMGIRAAAEASA